MNPSVELPLRDIHLPGPVSFWPLPVGFWLGLLLLALLGVSAYLFLKWRQKPNLKKEAKEAIQKIEEAFKQEGDTQKAVASLSVLLRRIAISYFGEDKAAVTGKKWLLLLDTGLKTREFSEGVGKRFLDAPYSPALSCEECSMLLELCKKRVDTL